MLGFGHLMEMRIRMQQNDALRRSRRKAKIKKKPSPSIRHQASAISSKYVIEKWSKKEIIFTVIIVSSIVAFVVYYIMG